MGLKRDLNETDLGLKRDSKSVQFPFIRDLYVRFELLGIKKEPPTFTTVENTKKNLLFLPLKNTKSLPTPNFFYNQIF